MIRFAFLILGLSALFVACSGEDDDTPAASDPETREQVLRETVVDAFRAFKDGETDNFYEYFSEDFHDRCNRDDFGEIMVFARLFIQELSEDELTLTIGEITFDGDDTASVEVAIESGEDSSGITSSTDDDFLHDWTLEDGTWKTDIPGDEPCSLSSSDDDDDDEETPEATGPGTSREEALPLGETIRTGDLEVTVVSANLDAADAVLAGNEFNDPPSAGNRFVLVTVRVRHAGGGSDSIQVSTSDFKLTGSKNLLYDTFGDASCGGFIEDEISGEMFPDGELEGVVCYQIPIDETDLILVAQPFFSFEDGDRRFLAIE